MIVYTNRLSQKCQCCSDYKINAPFYEWYTFLHREYIGLICKKCAARELFGSKYKTNKKYKEWLKKEKNNG